MDRRAFLAMMAAAGACGRRPAVAVEEVDIATLGAMIRDGRATARDLVDAYLTRIQSVDRTGPALNSVIELNPEARAIADALDQEFREKGPRGPLHGIPILI